MKIIESGDGMELIVEASEGMHLEVDGIIRDRVTVRAHEGTVPRRGSREMVRGHLVEVKGAYYDQSGTAYLIDAISGNHVRWH